LRLVTGGSVELTEVCALGAASDYHFFADALHERDWPPGVPLFLYHGNRRPDRSFRARAIARKRPAARMGPRSPAATIS
jgi:hypothetical protein